MIGTSLTEYIFIRTCIFLLHLVAPASIIYSLANVLINLPFQLPRLLHGWLALEAGFYLAIYLPYKRYLQKPAKHPTLPRREDRRKLFWRCHNTIPDPALYLRKWFRGADETEIKRENVKEFFRWAFLNTGKVDPAVEEEVEEYAGEMEKLLGRKFEEGRGNAECLRLTLNKVEMLHRSLTWYLCVSVVDVVTSVCMKYHSFDFYHTSFIRSLAIFPLRPLNLFPNYRSPGQSLTYWHRSHTSMTKLPILFIHGIGVGLYPYINFLADVNANGEDSSDGQVGIIAIEIMSVSSRITVEALLKDEICSEVHCILKGHGWEKFVLVSHSYGSVVATHLLRTPETAQTIGPVLFVDPVSFLLHHPDVAYNFICRKPTRANEHLLSYFGSKDIGISHTLFRRFFWAENVLWKEDICGHQVTVALAGRDIIINTKVIREYLTGSADESGGLDVLWFPELDHGEAFNDKRARDRLVQTVKRLCAQLT